MGGVLFTDTAVNSGGLAGSVAREILAVVRDPGMQWMVFLCLGVYLTTFLLLEARSGSRAFGRENYWLVGLLLIAAVRYAMKHSVSGEVLTLLGGVVIGKGMGLIDGRCQMADDRGSKAEDGGQRTGGGRSVRYWIPFILVGLLATAPFLNANPGRSFEYRGLARSVGPWDNPNIFGLLMGTGMVLAAALAVFSFQFSVFSDSEGKNRKLRVVRYGRVLCALLCLLAAILMGRGLLHSYSRGAWLAAFCGLGYLAFRVLSFEFLVFSSWIRRNWLLLAGIAASLAILMFWEFRHSESVPARRAVSAANVNDFSWRNRMAAWEGSLQIIAEHPWFGAGWNRPQRLYDQYYLPTKVGEGAAIQMNDYLMLGATLGIPALVCLGVYVWLSLTRNLESKIENSESSDIRPPTSLLAVALAKASVPCPLSSALLPATCRAGAVVLAVGFWFDGGLFKLPTAATFWILLELGRSHAHRGGAEARRGT